MRAHHEEGQQHGIVQLRWPNNQPTRKCPSFLRGIRTADVLGKQEVELHWLLPLLLVQDEQMAHRDGTLRLYLEGGIKGS
ncbi:unnamed protein product [Hydatigera taeniaeformis]|uniref:Uncharacterized protein n=1 Tax=Hydatigena taeniaeformis TaxID=6205 RepID=A0A0R3WTU5_HYDTA|nr:unnamed protein product [Hydatigera taeniaeformis]